MSIAELNESHQQIRGAWRHFALGSRTGEIIDTPEVFIAAGNVTWPMMNVAFLPSPVETEVALSRAAATAAHYFAQRRLGWMFFLSEDWVAPSLRPRIPGILGAHGLELAMETTGMVAELVEPPVRPLPPLEVRRITQAEDVRNLADINAISYDVPLELGREAFASPSMFQGESQGYVGHVDGKAVATTAIIRVEGIAYVALVATLPEYRRRGYAEAVMRHGLQEVRQAWGVERTVLHASEAGYPIYRRMGYRDVTRVGFYMAGAHGH